MSVAMAASFMPSMAFAAVGHTTHTPNIPNNCDWSKVDEVLKSDDAKYVEVVKKPTHTETGLVKVTCKEDFCKETSEITVKALGHDKEFVSKDITLEAYANAMVAQKESGFENQYKANAWVKAQKADGKCYVMDAETCSCGYVKPVKNANLVSHNSANKVADCKDYTCAKCGETIKGRAHVNADFAKNADKKVKVSEPTCGKGTGYKSTCEHCGAEGVWYDKDVKTDAHNFGTAVTLEEAGTLQKDGTYTIKSGYVAYDMSKNAILNVGTTGVVKAYSDDYKFYKLNDVIKAGDCTHGAQMGLKCTVCGENLKDATTNSTVLETTTATHDWEKTHVAATCDHAGYNKFVCKVCGDTKANEDLSKTEPKLAHSYKVTKKAATCETEDTYAVECTTCEKECTAHKGTYTLAQLKAAFPAAEVVADTKAKTETVYWPGYDNELKGNTKIAMTFSTAPMTHHKWLPDVEVKAATCTADALYGQKCVNCNKYNLASVYTKTGTKLGHNFVKHETAATCGTAGYYIEQCSRCNEYKLDATGATTKEFDAAKKIVTAKPVVAAGTKCTFDKVVILKDSTVFEEGVKTFECSKCGARDTAKESIAKKTVGKSVVKLTTTKGKMTVKGSAANATGYKVTYKRAGKKAVTKTYTAKSISKTYRLLKGKKYTVTVTAFATNGTDTVNGTTVTKTITIKNSIFLKTLYFQGFSPVGLSYFMYFPLFLPL